MATKEDRGVPEEAKASDNRIAAAVSRVLSPREAEVEQLALSIEGQIALARPSLFSGILTLFYTKRGTTSPVKFYPWVLPVFLFSGLLLLLGGGVYLKIYLALVVLLCLMGREAVNTARSLGGLSGGRSIRLNYGILLKSPSGGFYASCVDCHDGDVYHLPASVDGGENFVEGERLLGLSFLMGKDSVILMFLTRSGKTCFLDQFSVTSGANFRGRRYYSATETPADFRIARFLLTARAARKLINQFFVAVDPITRELTNYSYSLFGAPVRTAKPMKKNTTTSGPRSAEPVKAQISAAAKLRKEKDLFGCELEFAPDDSNTIVFSRTDVQGRKYTAIDSEVSRAMIGLADSKSDRAALVLVTGGSGTGKTILPRAFRIKRVLSGAETDQEAIRLAFNYAEWREHEDDGRFYRSVFFDDVDEWATLPSGRLSPELSAFIGRMDALNSPRNTIFIAARDKSLIPEKLLERVSHFIELKVPGKVKRERFISHLFNRADGIAGLRVHREHFNSLILKSEGLSYLQIEQFFDLGLQDFRKSNDFSSFAAALQRFRKERGVKVSDSASWKNLILPESLHSDLEQLTNLISHSEEVRKSGFSVPKAMLLWGPPGTGKTEIARTIANEAGVNFMAAGTSDMKGVVLGRSGKMTADLFAAARAKSPCILFIDEIETVAADRSGSKSDQYTNEIVTQMLQEMDGVKESDAEVFVMAATNYPDDIDAAIRSRFSRKIEIPLPVEIDRARMLWKAAFKIVQPKEEDERRDLESAVKYIAAKSEGLSGRDIYSGVKSWSEQVLAQNIEALREEGGIAPYMNPASLKNYFENSVLQ